MPRLQDSITTDAASLSSSSTSSARSSTSIADTHSSSSPIDQELANLTAALSLSDSPTSSESNMPGETITTFKVGTLSFNVDVEKPTENVITHVGRLYTKEHRPDVGSQDEKDLIAAITANQYDKYQMIATSVKDVESLQNNLSVTKRLELTRDCWERYDLLDPCNIVFPIKDNSADLKREVTADGSTGEVLFMDLFKHHRKLTVHEVARSCEYYQRFVTFEDQNKESCTFAKEMTWSYNHFRKNVESSLYETVNTEFRMFPIAQQGGPLFLKLLLDHLVITNEEQLAALVLTTTTYDIKMKTESEDIIEVIKLLSSITETIIALRDNQEEPLPELYVQKLLKVFQTTSVDVFNADFRRLEEDIKYNRLYGKTTRATALTARGVHFVPSSSSNEVKLDNTPDSTVFLFQFAREAYRMYKENGEWDAATKTKKGSAFTADSARAFFSQQRRCWNCGSPNHDFPQCPEPYVKERVDKNRALFREARAKQQSETGSTGRRSRGNGRSGPPYKYRPPEPAEHNKRVIDNVPHTYNPTIRRWEKDETPDAGIDNSIADDRTKSPSIIGGMTIQSPTHSAQLAGQHPVQTSAPSPSGMNVQITTNPSVAETSLLTDRPPPADLAQLQLQAAHLQQLIDKWS